MRGAEYERLIDLGVFQPGEAIELIGGELMVAAAEGLATLDVETGAATRRGRRRP